MSGALPVDTLPLSLSAAAIPVPGDRESDVMMAVSLPQTATISQAPSGAAGRSLQGSLLAAAFDTRLKLRGEQRRAFRLPPYTADGDARDVVATLRLPPGTYQIRVAVGTPSGTGSVFADLDVPDVSRQALSIAGMFVRRSAETSSASPARAASAIPGVPAATRLFERSSHVAFWGRLLQQARPPARAEVTVAILTQAGARVLDVVDEFRPGPPGPSEADYEFDLPLSRLSPGDYVLDIDVRMASHSAHWSSSFTVH
jgi:hypothetical protein